MCAFEYELRTAIEGFVEDGKPFTSMALRDKIREDFNMPCRYKEVNYETLTHMQRNGAEYGYVARSVQVVTGYDILDQPEHAQVWEFAPIKTVVEDFGKDEDAETEVVVTQKADGGFFNRIFQR